MERERDNVIGGKKELMGEKRKKKERENERREQTKK